MSLNSKAMLITVIFMLFSFFSWNSNVSGSDENKDLIVLTKDNTLVLQGEVNGENISEVIIKAENLSKPKRQANKPIYLFMNTPGGEIQTGLEFIETLKGLKRPVNTITLFSASMGFQIVQNLGERLIFRDGTLMSHRARGGFEGYFGGKKGSQLDKRYAFWLNKLEELDKQTVKRTNGKQTLESYKEAYADEMWLTGQQAVDGGYADRIVSIHCDDSLSGTSVHKAEFMGFHLLYDLDNCPINTNPMNVRLAPEEEKNVTDHRQLIDIKQKFVEQYFHRQRSVVPMYW